MRFRLKNSNILAWQLNPQLYIVGAAPKCTTSVAKLSPLQNAMCTTGYMDHISSVNVGLLIALKECRFQFKANKWNCTGPTLESMLEGVTDIRGKSLTGISAACFSLLPTLSFLLFRSCSLLPLSPPPSQIGRAHV